MVNLGLKTFYIVDRTLEHATEDAVERYVNAHGGASIVKQVTRDTGFQLACHIVNQIRIPGSQDLIFEIKIHGARSGGESEEDEDGYEFT